MQLFMKGGDSMTFPTKITTALVTAALVTGVIAPAAFADTTVSVNGNDAGSHSMVNVHNFNGTSIHQHNMLGVAIVIDSNANTGNNHTGFNTNGASIVNTGSATSNVNIGVGGNSNYAVLPNCGCGTSKNTVNVEGNGPYTKNHVNVTNTNWLGVFQNNLSTIFTGVVSHSNTGGNSTSFNTGGLNGIGTGDATSNVNVTVNGSSNAQY